MATPTAKYNIVATDKSSAAIGKIKGKLSGLGGAFSGFGASIAGIVGVGGFGAMIKGSLDAADQVQKLSLQLGVSSQFLSEMSHAAGLSGLTMTDLETSLRRMQVNLVESEGKANAVAQSFEGLGLDITELIGMGAEDAFATINEAIGKMPNTIDQTAARVAIFGRSGAKMGQLFAEGAEGVAKMRAEAVTLGLSLSGDQVDAAAAANDALLRLQSTFTGLGNTMAVSFAEPLTNIIDGIRENVIPILTTGTEAFIAFGEGLGAIAAIAENVFKGNFEGASSIVDDLIGSSETVNRLETLLKENGEAATPAGGFAPGDSRGEMSGTIINGKEQEKTRDKIVETNSLLKQVVENTRGASGAVAG